MVKGAGDSAVSKTDQKSAIMEHTFLSDINQNRYIILDGGTSPKGKKITQGRRRGILHGVSKKSFTKKMTLE